MQKRQRKNIAVFETPYVLYHFILTLKSLCVFFFDDDVCRAVCTADNTDALTVTPEKCKTHGD